MTLEIINVNDIESSQWVTWQACLSPEEVERANRYRLAIDRKTFVAGRGLVRQLAAEVSGLPMNDLSIITTAMGKPMVAELMARFQFSISHSAEYLALLWHPGPEPIGVDIEKRKLDFDYAPIVHSYFSEHECSLISNADDFLRLWTQKEAILKAQGTGLLDDLKAVSAVANNRVRNSLDSDLPKQSYLVKSFRDDKVVVSCALPVSLSNQEIKIPSENFLLVG